MGYLGKYKFGQMVFWKNGVLGKWFLEKYDFGQMVFLEYGISGNWFFGKNDILEIYGFWDFGKWNL